MSAAARLRELEGACEAVAAPGTDPAVLARVIGWAVRPRRHLDALRRRCRDTPEPLGLVDAIGSSVSVDDVAAARPLLAAWSGLGVQAALVGDAAYPPQLAEGWPHLDGPTLLAWRGAPPTQRPAVALVGSRRATGYGLGVTAWLAEAAANAGVRVVSGGAVGIDAAAHEAALAGPAGTTVVLGCGHQVRYPRPHARDGGLFDRILEHGGSLVSELLPHEPPHPGQVRARNRIVAGLADVVVVVEGREGSGALLTAASGAERGRVVLAVPGDVRAPGSSAPHRLLADGAAPCTGPADLLAGIRAVAAPRHGAARGFGALGDGARGAGSVGDDAGGQQRATVADGRAGAAAVTALPEEAHRVLAQAWPRPVPLDRLAAASGRPVPALLAAITRARVAGEIVEAADGIRLRQAPA